MLTQILVTKLPCWLFTKSWIDNRFIDNIDILKYLENIEIDNINIEIVEYLMKKWNI